MKNGRKNINPIWFVIAILTLIVGIPLGVIIYFYVSLNFPLISETLYDYRYVWLVAIVGLLVIVIFSFILFPIVLFLIKRISCYFSLWFVCKKNGLAFKLTRFPLASLWGISEKEDIKVSTSDENYCVHFIDMVFRARRGFTLINEKEYCIAEMRVEMRGSGGGFIKGQYCFPMVFAASSTPKAYTTYAFPDFDDSKGKHIIIVHPTPNHALYIDKICGKDGKREIYSGYSVGNITYYSIHGLKKLLDRN